MQQSKETREGVGGAAVNFQAETVIAEVPLVSLSPGHPTAFFEAVLAVTATAGATEATFRVRREGVAGLEVGKLVVSLVKSAKQSIGFNVSDTPGTDTAGMTYVLTGTSAAAENQVSVSSRLQVTY